MQWYIKYIGTVLFLAFILMTNSCTNSAEGIENEAQRATLDTVLIKGMAFQPAELNVRIGDTVIWVNEDIVPHDVAAFPGNEWGSDTLAMGQSWKKVIMTNIDYFCNIHPTMKGKVFIEN